jgi:hypothetical protein
MAHVIRFDEGFRWDSGLYWDQLVPDHPPKKGARMPSDFIPQNWAAYRAWLLNLKTKIATLGASFGLTSGQITSVQSTCQSEIDKIDAYVAAQAAADAALETVRDFKGTTDTALREEIRHWKMASGWTDATATELKVVGTGGAFDPDSYKPEFTVKIVGGEIRLDWKKKGADGVRVYCRCRGESTWKFLALDTSSPYIDGAPLEHAGVPEVREYMLRGVVNDEEIGLDSDILSVTWAGN